MSEDINREEKTIKKRNPNQREMSFLEHLEELRWHIIRSAIVIVVFAIVAFIMKDFIFNVVLLNPKTPDFWTNRMFAKLGDLIGSESIKINQHDLELISIKMAGQFSAHIWTSIVAGMIVASPVVFYEFWKFISPALYDKEKKAASGAVFYTTSLFIIGILFGYFLIVPLSVHFLGSYNVSSEVGNKINLTSYIGTVTTISLASGIVFLLPVFVYFLSKVGLLTPESMKKYRKHAYVVLLLLSAIITPPDIFSQILVCLPLVFLYEIGIIISRRVVKKLDKQLDEI
ncbi:Twin-arginine translocation protein TatC [hydrothermal vent metagenome]|uniref:Twin-arginine translocation protein TatC n=1 Tax=hydrothermal vent metagenome TaxID=652676 RepID=A0A3B0TNC6_9ZZZZ